MSMSTTGLLLAPLLAPHLLNYFKMEPTQAPMLNMVIVMLMGKLDNLDFSMMIEDSRKLIFMGLFIITVFYWRHTRSSVIVPMSLQHDPRTIRIKLHKKDTIASFLKYLHFNPAFISPIGDLEHGDLQILATLRSLAFKETGASPYAWGSASRAMQDLEDLGRMTKVPLNQSILFTDSILGVKGTFTWKEQVHTTNKGAETITIPYLYLLIELKDTDKNSHKVLASRPTDYLLEVEKWLRQKTKNHIKCFAFNASFDRSGLPIGMGTVIGYEGVRLPLPQLERQYIHSLIQPQTQLLWQRIKAIDAEAQSLICADLDGKDDVKLDAKDENKCIMSAIGQTPAAAFLLHGPPGTGKSAFAARVAKALQRHLISVDLRNIKTLAQLLQWVRSPLVKGEPVNVHTVVYVFEEFDKAIDELISNEAQRQAVESKHSLMRQRQLESFDDKTLEDGEKKRKFFDFANGIDTLKDTQLQLAHLLEVFSGPIMPNGFLAFANTNDYPKLQRAVPALFRDGRLNPVHFGLFDKHLLNAFSKFHFQRTVFHSDHSIKMELCPAGVAQWLIDAKLACPTSEDGAFHHFQLNVRKAVGRYQDQTLLMQAAAAAPSLPAVQPQPSQPILLTPMTAPAE